MSGSGTQVIPGDLDVLEEVSLAGGGDVRIRRFAPGDRDAIGRICCDTGFLGRPIDSIFQDRELFADLMAEPYLRYQPDLALVAECEGRVAGYLLGAVRPDFERLQMFCGFQTVSKMLFRCITGRYADHPRSRGFLAWLFLRAARERPQHPDGASHIHFNLENGARGRWIGKYLWLNFEKLVLRQGIDLFYGEFYSHARRRPERVYSRLGMRVYARRLTTVFRPEITEPVENVCVQCRLPARFI